MQDKVQKQSKNACETSNEDYVTPQQQHYKNKPTSTEEIKVFDLPSLNNSTNLNGTRPVRFSFNKNTENSMENIDLPNQNSSSNENTDSNNSKSNYIYTKINHLIPIGPITNPAAHKLYHLANSPQQQQQIQEQTNQSQNGYEKAKSHTGLFFYLFLFKFKFYFKCFNCLFKKNPSF